MCGDFHNWAKSLPKLTEIKVNRPYFTGTIEHAELHIFGDSSEAAFGAVAFLRASVRDDTNCSTQLAFIMGKGRVAPMKALSIPKLELQGALLASRLKKVVEAALSIEIENCFMWTDSTTVLQ